MFFYYVKYYIKVKASTINRILIDLLYLTKESDKKLEVYNVIEV